jgi:hypothetical protein
VSFGGSSVVTQVLVNRPVHVVDIVPKTCMP